MSATLRVGMLIVDADVGVVSVRWTYEVDMTGSGNREEPHY